MRSLNLLRPKTPLPGTEVLLTILLLPVQTRHIDYYVILYRHGIKKGYAERRSQ